MYTIDRLTKDFEESKLFTFKNQLANLDYVVKNDGWNITFNNERRTNPSIQLARFGQSPPVYEICVVDTGSMIYTKDRYDFYSYVVKRNGQLLFVCPGQWHSQAKVKRNATMLLFSVCSTATFLFLAGRSLNSMSSPNCT